MTTTYDDEIVVSGGSAQAGEYELLPEGAYTFIIDKIENFEGRDFKTNEPKAALKFIYLVADGEWQNEEVSQIVPLVKNMANDKAWLHQLWKAATGETPVEGGTYKIRSGLTGKRLLGVIEHKANANGNVWPRIKSVSQVGQPRQRRQAPPPPVVDDSDDDLRDA